MIHLKNHNNSGFMLMEIMFTIAIVGIALAPIFVLQNNALRSLIKFSSKVKMIFPAKNFLVKSFNMDKASGGSKTGKKQVVKPVATITYLETKVSQSSMLKNIKDIDVIKVNILSSGGAREALLGFVYNPEQEKK